MSIEDVVYRAVHDYPGGVPALAARMDMSKHVLQNKINPNNQTHHLTAKELMRVQMFTGSKEIAKFVAADAGMVCFPMPKHEGASDMEILDLYLAKGKEEGEWDGAVKSALADGVVDPGEMENIDKEYLDYCAADAELMSRIRSMVTERRKVAR